jgi:ACS family D-galactonate transporter-like MFS transporter
VVVTWFPDHERAQATAAYTVGEYLGLACFGPLLFWIASRFGWRYLFFATGGAGLLFAGWWWNLYRDPESAGGGAGAVAAKPIHWAQIRELLRYRQVWGASIGQFGGNTTLVFFLTWFPSYLAKERHMDWTRAGFFAILPFVAAGCGVLLGGWGSDVLLKRTGSRNLARKLPVVGGLFGASTIILANYVTSDALVIAILSFAFFSQGLTGLGWAVISDIAPHELVGLTGGIFSFAANVAGVTTPILVGLVIGATGSFFYALLYIGAAALLGAFSYVFLLGDVERIRL